MITPSRFGHSMQSSLRLDMSSEQETPPDAMRLHVGTASAMSL